MKIKATISFPLDLYCDIEKMEKMLNCNKAEVIRKALNTYKYFLDKQEDGGKIEIINYEEYTKVEVTLT